MTKRLIYLMEAESDLRAQFNYKVDELSSEVLWLKVFLTVAIVLLSVILVPHFCNQKNEELRPLRPKSEEI